MKDKDKVKEAEIWTPCKLDQVLGQQVKYYNLINR